MKIRMSSRGFSSCLVALSLVFAMPASAAEEYDVSVSGSTVVVKTKGTWHINKEYPWKLTVGEVKVDKAKFKLEEGVASVADAPKGTGKLKGSVCSKEQCLMIAVDVTVN